MVVEGHAGERDGPDSPGCRPAGETLTRMGRAVPSTQDEGDSRASGGAEPLSTEHAAFLAGSESGLRTPGGRPAMAQGTGTRREGLADALFAVEAAAREATGVPGGGK